jgi:GAF domain-containing protein
VGPPPAAAPESGVAEQVCRSTLLSLKTMSHAGFAALVALMEELGRAQAPRRGDASDAPNGTPAVPLAQSILEAALAAVPADGGSVMVYEPASEAYEVRAASGLREPWAIAAARRRLGEGIAGLAVAERRVLLLDDTCDDPRIQDRMARPDVVSSIVAPMAVGPSQPVLGVLNVRSHSPLRRFTKDHVAVITKFATLAAHALAAAS